MAGTIRIAGEDDGTVVMRVVLGVAGVLLLLAGLAAAGLAVWGSAVFGSDGALRFGAGTITPAPGSVATIIDVERFSASVPYVDRLGTTSLSVTSGDAGDPTDTVFLGAAGTAAVDAYLKGTPYSVALRGDGTWTVREVPGVALPPLPRGQDLWITDDVGRRASIEVPADRPLTLVLMHPSGIPSGPLTLTVDFTVPGVVTWVVWLLAAAGVLIIAGAVLLVLAVRMRRRPAGRHAAGAAPVQEAAPASAEEESDATVAG